MTIQLINALYALRWSSRSILKFSYVVFATLCDHI